ncbi:hypothetical protein JF729_23785 [Mycobacterium intracellulare]|uniref:hypothetical protein n=1 Tax=Mycobacterium intracellulare TaxID=1767 RepID=UPI001CD95EF7|nr:hypothetical protein [Mycobacterium intracellulare]MCA2250805.1 hypothetical protein [Mycobacterium intracellulare]
MTAWTLCVIIGKVALLSFLVVAVVTIIVVRRRRMRAARAEFLRRDPSELLQAYTRPAQPGYEASVRGAMPHTPLPSWVYHGDQDTADPPS